MAHVTDVSRMTLRELAWAAEGADRAEHARLTRLESFMASLNSKKPTRPGRMDPYHAVRAATGEASVETRGSKHAEAERAGRGSGRTRIRYLVNGVGVPRKFFNDRMER